VANVGKTYKEIMRMMTDPNVASPAESAMRLKKLLEAVATRSGGKEALTAAGIQLS